MKLFLKKYIKKEYFFIYLILTIFLFLVLFKVNGSSVGMYDKYFYGDSYSSEGSLLFEPRSIRSDEWLVGTPLIISQSFNKKSVNLNIQGLGSKNIAMISVPVMNFKTIFHPNIWGFFLMNIESAFSFYWWANDFILLFFLYLFLLKITKKNILISATFSVVILFSPFLQWWRGAAISTPAYGFACLYFLMLLIERMDLKKRIFLSLLLAYFVICYVFVLYPPFQVGFALFMFFFLIGYVLENRKKINKKKILGLLISIMIVIIMVGFVILAYLNVFGDVVNIIANTSYPGKRLVVHGRYSLIQLFNGFYNMQFLCEAKGSALFGNQSEGSNFFMISLFMLPLFFTKFLFSIFKKEKLDFIFTSLLIFLIFILIVLFIPIPELIYKMTLLNIVPDNRIILSFGIANLILLAYFLNKDKFKKNIFYNISSFLSLAIALFINFYIGFVLKNNYPVFIQNNIKIILISLFSGLLVFLIINKKQKMFCFLLIVITFISSYKINPVRLGIDSLIKTPFAIEVKKIKQNNPKSRWVVYDNIILSNFLVANGINTISGTFLYPQIELMRNFDESGLYENIWNRYAHVVFNGDKKNKEPSFNLNQFDSFSISVNPCSSVFKNLNVDYFVFPYLTNDYSCLELVKEFNYSAQRIAIYKN